MDLKIDFSIYRLPYINKQLEHNYIDNMNQTVTMILFMQTHFMDLKDYHVAIIANTLIKNDKIVTIYYMHNK